MLFGLVALFVTTTAAIAAPQNKETANSLGLWATTKGEVADGAWLQSKNSSPLEMVTSSPLEVPVTATFAFRAAVGDSLSIMATPDAADKKAKPWLQARFTLSGDNRATVQARADGNPMATDIVSTRAWSQTAKKRDTLTYQWRFPKVGNLWDESDRREIGAAYAKIVPFEEKLFTLRLVLLPESRQIWLDDRLVAEEKGAGIGKIQFVLQLDKSTRVLSTKFEAPTQTGLFHPLPLTHYSLAKGAAASESHLWQLKADKTTVPLWEARGVDIDLGDSLYRYRNTTGSGPNAGYVNAQRTWPGAFEVDPAKLTFRVPYRTYQNAWLLAWKDDEAGAVAKGALRFFREDAGYPAATDFEISEAAIKSGRVQRLRKNADGKQLYLVKVPVDTSAFYGLRDLQGQPLDFELTKPLQLTRSYPDPIYYGSHPGGPPSSIHVVGITLEEAPFSYEVKPTQYAHVFENPQKPEYVVAVTNNTAQPLAAEVLLTTRSYDGLETETAQGATKIAPGVTGEIKLSLNLKKNGWHELKAQVQAGGVAREVKLSLLNLPRNTRTYGNAPNETRFGTWNLLGHYQPLTVGDPAANAPFLAMLRKLGLRRVSLHTSFFTADLLKQYDLLPDAPHTLVSIFHRLDENDPEAMKAMVIGELAQMEEHSKDFAQPPYLYGGEWAISHEIQYGQWPAYTGEGDRDLTPEETKRIVRQTKIFTAIGRAMREKYPNVKLYLQWGAPKGTIAFLRHGFPKELVDGFGMDAPMFELLPELSNIPGSINDLWTVRQEAKKFGWPRLPIRWVEGPFFPTNPGALTENEQADRQIRYFMAGLAYGVEDFDAGVVPFDAGNYYGAEHYGAGVFHRTPLMNPKPAAAAIATATQMLNGADVVGGVDTGVLTTYCMAFRNATTKENIYALWRVDGTVTATIKVRGNHALLTDAMGNGQSLPIKDGTVKVPISSSPIWLTGVEIENFAFDAPEYSAMPAPINRTLATMNADQWNYDANADEMYETNHFAIKRVTDANLKAAFGQGEADHADAVSITLDKETSDRPLATRYGALQAKRPIPIPGKANALGMWIRGNSGWGRIAYQLRDAKGEIWTSIGTRDDWNADDTHAWSYVDFESWRYVRFPLPGNLPYDGARTLETTWWGSRDGDGIVDLPLSIEKVFVEARNEVPYLSEMKIVPERSYKLSQLIAEYSSTADTTPQAVVANAVRMPVVQWNGPQSNLIAQLQEKGVGAAPILREFTEPGTFNDGRRMTIHFEQREGLKYNLYVARYADGRGAELLRAGVTDEQIVTGFRPETEMYLFLTSVGADKKESKPSAPQRLVTHDNFREK
jgi:hypothetical protein